MYKNKTMKQLLEFQKKVTAIKKDGKNPHFKSTYATLSQIIGEVKPILSEVNVVLLQPIKDGKVGCVLIDESGKTIAESWLDLPQGMNPQQMGSAITYYRRYALASLLSLELEDDDANLASQTNQKPWLNKDTDVYKQAVEHLKKGGKIADIEVKFQMSKEVRQSLESGI